ncbi:MAG: M48 family metalloprotease [Elusimicrobiota bacterium]
MRTSRILASVMLAGAFVSSFGSSASAAGSSEELSFYGASLLNNLDVKESRTEAPAIKNAVEVPQKGGRGEDNVQIPPDARRFLPDYMTTASPGSLADKDSSIVQEKAQALADHFKKFYPDVTYHINWDDDTVNAYAYKDWFGGAHVALLGGLLRHNALKIEGIALVLSHELGHHYGGEPYYPGQNMSCEGQADYWGAGVGMRRAYSGSYRETLTPGIDQVITLFTGGVKSSKTPEEQMNIFQEAKGCEHPPAACRKETYLAAMNDQPKPACAGFTGSSTDTPVALSLLDKSDNGG